MKEYGRIGQKRWEGIFSEEFLPELTGLRGIKVYQEMERNDDTIGAILFAITVYIVMSKTTFGYQLRRFIRRLIRTANALLDRRSVR